MGPDLEVELAADRAGVAGPADPADGVTRPDSLAVLNGGGLLEVGVSVVGACSPGVDHDPISIEDRIRAAGLDAASAGGHHAGAAGGEDVLPLVHSATAAWGPEALLGPTVAVRPSHREFAAEDANPARRPGLVSRCLDLQPVMPGSGFAVSRQHSLPSQVVLPVGEGVVVGPPPKHVVTADELHGHVHRGEGPEAVAQLEGVPIVDEGLLWPHVGVEQIEASTLRQLSLGD